MSGKVKKTTESFINEVSEKNQKLNIIGEYINSNTKIKCKCKKCGYEWEMLPSNILKGKGCPECYNKSNKGKKSLEQFIEDSIKVHGNKYNYDKVNYINNYTKVIITCPKHGDFLQTPNSHLSGKGCIKCGKESMSDKKRKSTQQFISEAIKIHGNKYDYSKTNYIDRNTKIIIICPEHGEFQQIPHSHLEGKGCPICNMSHGELLIKNILDKSKINYIYQYKINIDKIINISGNSYIDFYLPKYNLFIEYNGEQHYIAKDYFGGIVEFKRQKQRDNYISNYCKNNNIRLLEIPYTLKRNEVIDLLNKTLYE